VIKRR